MAEIYIKTNGAEICSESFGNLTDPAVLLIMGASASMIWWDEEFCKRLAGYGKFVIRYDNRDVGRSSFCEPGKPDYDVIDMAEDAISVINHYGISKVHIAGLSLGGMIAQLLALIHPQRVLSLTIISSGIWDDRPDLPPIEQKVLDYHTSGVSVDWNNRKAVTDFMVEGLRILNGSFHPFDEEKAYNLAENEINRARNLQSMFNHALLKGGESFYGQAGNIKTPTLVIHGTEDPVLPFKHAEAIINEIPGSGLIKLDGRGHEIHQRDWDIILNAIAQHTK